MDQPPDIPQEIRPQATLEEAPLIDRIYSYSLVNNLFTNYQVLKDSNEYLKYGLSGLENAASTSIALSTPVLNAVNERLSERGVDLQAAGHLILNQVFCVFNFFRLTIEVEDKAKLAQDYYDSAQKAATNAFTDAQNTVEHTQQKVSDVTTGVTDFIATQQEQITSGEAVDKLLDLTGTSYP